MFSNWCVGGDINFTLAPKVIRTYCVIIRDKF